ncbi:MAG: cAMP/cGMP binding protein [uncultured bacterium]|nr:MAG: cAMP/cGMP binding protein [uncultured bacterium]
MDVSHEEKIRYLKSCYLFTGLSAKQLERLASKIQEISADLGDTIIQENDPPGNIFIIKEGLVEIRKFDKETNTSYRLGFLGKGEVVGDMAFFDETLRSASVIAAEPTRLFVLSGSDIEQEKKSLLGKIFQETPMGLIIAKNAAKNMSRRIRIANNTVIEGLKKELSQMQTRQAMSVLIVTTLVLFSLYVFVVQAMSHLQSFVFSTTFLSVPLLIFFMIPIAYVIKKSDYPLSMYGLSLVNWRQEAAEAIKLTIPLLLIILFYKWMLLHYVPNFMGRPLFDWNADINEIGNYNEAPLRMKILPIALYAVFIPVQEFLVRGVLQSSFQRMLLGQYRLFWAIILANLIYSASHVYISITLGFMVFLPGLFWGWLYSRQKTIVGVSVSHFITGLWAFYIVGIS